MKTLPPTLGKFLYAFIFLAALPALLILWAFFTAPLPLFPVVFSPTWGLIIGIFGLGWIVWGMYALKIHGKGLPMNAYPPENLVQQGPYRWLRHPIYWGFGFLVAGVSVFYGSASGLWLVTPVVILGMVALVWGYEKPDLEQRFPQIGAMRVFWALPPDVPEKIRPAQRLAAILQVGALWWGGNALAGYLAGPTPPLFDWPWPAMPGGAFVAGAGLLFAAGVPFVLQSQAQLRAWTVSAWIGLGLSLYIALLWPAAGGQYRLSGALALPADTGLWSTPLLLLLLGARFYGGRFPAARILFWLAALALGYGQLALSRSPGLHLLSGGLFYLIAAHHFRLWHFILHTAETVANSWKEWVFGPVRVINHGIYVGLGAFSGIGLAGILAGSAYAWAILIFTVIGLVFAALWAQVIEGSDKLKRPFGYYGSLVSIPFGCLALWFLGYQIWVVVGSVAVAMPWAQALGRLRCLVNGCCHGSPVQQAACGIRYVHPRSRVCGLSHLKGQPLHPTPVYSILWLFFTGFLLLALWCKDLPYPFISGVYLILTGLGRFVEEAYRGEVQTPVLAGLHLYQWTAFASVLAGMVMTAIPAERVALSPEAGWETLLAALLGGLFTFFAMGVDFPGSNARFSRLV